MKIYANTNPFNLDRFIGKDIWVKCIDTSVPHTYKEYIRVLSKRGDCYYVNKVPEFTVADFAGCSKQVLLNTLGGTARIPFNQYKICPEFEIYTTAELLGGEFEFEEDVYAVDTDLVSELAGQDIWILAQSVDTGNIYGGRYYIKIHSFKGTTITYSRVGADSVDEHLGFYLMDDDEIRDTILHVWISHVGDWTLYPEHEYTTEEISRKIGVEL